MRRVSHTTAMLLLFTLAAMLDTQAISFPAAKPGHVAGCHGAAAPSPRPANPAPVSYQCCVNGHHAAIPNASFSLRTSLRTVDAQLCRLQDGEGAHSDCVPLLNSALSATDSGSPPGIVPLRI